MIPATIPACDFWLTLPGAAAVDVNLPVTVTDNDRLDDMSDMLTAQQRWAINALDTLMGSGDYYGRKYSITVKVPGKGKPRMPIGVYCIEMMASDGEGNCIPTGNESYLHPDGALRTFYGGKF